MITFILYDYFTSIWLLLFYIITFILYDYFYSIRLLLFYMISFTLFDYFYSIRLLLFYMITFVLFDYFYSIWLLLFYIHLHNISIFITLPLFWHAVVWYISCITRYDEIYEVKHVREVSVISTIIWYITLLSSDIVALIIVWTGGYILTGQTHTYQLY